MASPYQHMYQHMAHLERLLQRSLSGDSTSSSDSGRPLPGPRHSLMPGTASLPLPLVAQSGSLTDQACCLSVPEDALQVMASSYAPDTDAMCEDTCCSWEPQPGAATAWRRQCASSSCQAVRSGSSGSNSSSSGGSSHHHHQQHQQEEVRAMAAAKLRAMRAVQEQLRSAEHRLQLVADGSKPSSPTAAARKPAAASPQQQQQLRQPMSTTDPGSGSSRHRHTPQHTGTAPVPVTPAAARLSRHGSGGSSTAATLLAAHADPTLVGEYLRCHRLQHQQHQACTAAVAATSLQHKGGMSPAAVAKLRQLMALQQQQIQAQQELLAMLA